MYIFENSRRCDSVYFGNSKRYECNYTKSKKKMNVI